MNNLLERLHASFFFYIMTSMTSFLKIGHYLPAVLLISVGTMFNALALWVDAGWREELGEKSAEWVRQGRSVLEPMEAMLVAHAMGLLAFYLFNNGWVNMEVENSLPSVFWFKAVSEI